MASPLTSASQVLNSMHIIQYVTSISTVYVIVTVTQPDTCTVNVDDVVMDSGIEVIFFLPIIPLYITTFRPLVLFNYLITNYCYYVL